MGETLDEIWAGFRAILWDQENQNMAALLTLTKIDLFSIHKSESHCLGTSKFQATVRFYGPFYYLCIE